MKKKIFMLLALVMTAMTASASAGFDLTAVASDYGTIAFTVGGEAATTADEGDVVTVTITPNTGYVVNQPSGQWIAAIAKAPRRTPGIDLLNEVELTPVANAENQWTFTMERANVEISATYKKLLTNEDISVTIAAATYTGKALEPTVTVKDGETTLVFGTDYTVAYSNNTAAALSTAENAPTMTITAVGNSQKYAGETTISFTINKAALTVTAEDKEVIFGDDAPTYTVKYDGFVTGETEDVLGGTLALACDYVKNETGVGEYAITPSGLTSDNYAITFTAGKLTVGQKSLEDDDITVADIDALIYTGLALEPNPVITFNGMTLVKDTDYTLAYEDNVNVGTATVTVTGTGNYSGEFTKTFTINTAEMANLTIILEETTVTYNGNEMKPAVTVKIGEITLVEGTDYTVAYSDNVNAGTATVTVTAVEGTNYTGTATKTFTIEKADAWVNFGDIYKFKKTYGDPTFTIQLEVVEGDGTLTFWSSNEEVATVDENTGEVTIVGAGKALIWADLSDGDNYVGISDWYELTVSPKTLEDAMVGDIAEQTYTGEELTPEVVVTDGDVTLIEGTDYTVEYANNTEMGQAIITGTGNYTGTVTKDFAVVMPKLALDEVEDNTETLAEADGKWYDVTLKRKLQAGSWNTLAVPFDIDIPDGWTVKELESTSLADGTLTLNFQDAESIEAGKPYLVKVAADVENPTFEGVAIVDGINMTETDAVDFIPTLGATTITGDDAKSVLFLAAGNKLKNPDKMPTDIKGFRAYFQLKGDALDVKSYTINLSDGETGIGEIHNSQFTIHNEDGTWYDLQGRRMNKAQKGVFIVNGKKTIIK